MLNVDSLSTVKLPLVNMKSRLQFKCWQVKCSHCKQNISIQNTLFGSIDGHKGANCKAHSHGSYFLDN